MLIFTLVLEATAFQLFGGIGAPLQGFLGAAAVAMSEPEVGARFFPNAGALESPVSIPKSFGRLCAVAAGDPAAGCRCLAKISCRGCEVFERDHL